MTITILQYKTKYFVSNYFNLLWFKFFIFQEILWILFSYFEHYYLLSSIIVSFVIILSSFLTSKFLQKENIKLIEKFYDKNNIKFVPNKKSTNEITIICNLKKFNGPTFGAFTLNSNSLIFTPFKHNLENERIKIDNINNHNVHMSVVNLRNSWINKVFFKGNLYCLELKWDGNKVILQMPNDYSNKALFELLKPQKE